MFEGGATKVVDHMLMRRSGTTKIKINPRYKGPNRTTDGAVVVVVDDRRVAEADENDRRRGIVFLIP